MTVVVTPSQPGLVLVANARMPSHRAQSLQLAQVSAAFVRAGCATTLAYAVRHPTPALPEGQDLFDFYGVPAGPRPALFGVPCTDWIDRVPTRLQFVPARIQELTFARNAARHVRECHAGAWVLSREIETARALTEAGGSADVFLEIHRVPGGRLRRKWLGEAAAGARGVVAISGGVKQDLVRAGIPAESILVEHDAMEPTRFAATIARTSARKELRLEQNAPVVVYTGGLMGWKGVDLLIEAAKLLPEISFVIAGGMEQDQLRLRRQARRVWNVRFDGFQSPERIPELPRGSGSGRGAEPLPSGHQRQVHVAAQGVRGSGDGAAARRERPAVPAGDPRPRDQRRGPRGVRPAGRWAGAG